MTAPLSPNAAPSGAVTDPAGMDGADGFAATLTVPSRIEFVRPAASFIAQTARALNVSGIATPLFDVAITEAIANAVKHGHGPEGARGTIVCELKITAAQLSIRVLDEGPGFAVPPPRLPQVSRDRVEALLESGYGLPIIQSVFRVVRAVRVGERFGLELNLPLI